MCMHNTCGHVHSSVYFDVTISCFPFENISRRLLVPNHNGKESYGASERKRSSSTFYFRQRCRRANRSYTINFQGCFEDRAELFLQLKSETWKGAFLDMQKS